MGLEGEEVYTGWAYANGDNFYSESWSIDMPPSDAFVKTSLCDVVALPKKVTVEIGILNIRYLLPDGSDGRANLDGIDWPNTIKAWSSPKMTHFTFAIKARQCYALMCCPVGYWRVGSTLSDSVILNPQNISVDSAKINWDKIKKEGKRIKHFYVELGDVKDRSINNP